MLRININIAIVAMVKQAKNDRNHSVVECLTAATYFSSVNQTSPAIVVADVSTESVSSNA